MTLTHGMLVGVAAATTTAVLVEVVRRLSLRWALLDRPNHRSSHVVPTPRLGGLGVAVCLLVALAWLAGTPMATAAQAGRLRTLAAIGMVVSLVSLLDDLRSLGAPLRLLVHLCAAGALVHLGGGTPVIETGSLVLHPPPVLGLALTVLWIAWFINAFNFMDGSDGIAGMQAAVAGLGWMVFGWLASDAALAMAGAILVGTMTGFLVHNWSPARIFLGDAGSALLGFLLATVPWVVGSPSWWPASVLVVWPFLFDTTITLIRRVWHRERVWQAHRSHLYQRLIVGGWSHRSVALLYAAFALIGVAAALSLQATAPVLPMTAAAVIVVAAGALWRTAQVASLSPGR